MIYILTSLSAFLISAVIHVLWARLQKLTKVKMISFVIVSLGVLLIYCLVLWLRPHIFSCSENEAWTLRCLPLKFTSVVLYLLSIPIYVLFYHSTTIESPSRKILKAVARQGKSTYAELLQQTKKEDFIKTRLDELVHYKCAAFDGQRYRITPHGNKVAQILNVYQLIMRREKGG